MKGTFGQSGMGHLLGRVALSFPSAHLVYEHHEFSFYGTQRPCSRASKKVRSCLTPTRTDRNSERTFRSPFISAIVAPPWKCQHSGLSNTTGISASIQYGPMTNSRQSKIRFKARAPAHSKALHQGLTNSIMFPSQILQMHRFKQ